MRFALDSHASDQNATKRRSPVHRHSAKRCTRACDSRPRPNYGSCPNLNQVVAAPANNSVLWQSPQQYHRCRLDCGLNTILRVPAQSKPYACPSLATIPDCDAGGWIQRACNGYRSLCRRAGARHRPAANATSGLCRAARAHLVALGHRSQRRDHGPPAGRSRSSAERITGARRGHPQTPKGVDVGRTDPRPSHTRFISASRACESSRNACWLPPASGCTFFAACL